MTQMGMHALRGLARYTPAIRKASLATGAVPGDNCFRLLGVPETFALDQARLSARFKQLQAEWHPDKFATRPARDQQAAAAMSARINVAHDVLTRPHRRARHLLSLREPALELDDVRPPAGFLAWVMEFREEVEQATGSDNADDLERLRAVLRERRSGTLDALDEAFRSGNTDDAAQATARLQYMHSIASAIDDLPP